MNMIFKPVICSAAVLVLILTFADQTSAQRVRLESRMTGNSIERLGSAKAKFEQRGTRLKFSCEAEDLRVSRRINVFVNGNLVGSANVNQFGTADLNLDTLLGNRVPRMSSGNRVQVYNQNSSLIFQGTLRQK